MVKMMKEMLIKTTKMMINKMMINKTIVDDTTRKIDRKRKTETEKLLDILYKSVFWKRKRQLK